MSVAQDPADDFGVGGAVANLEEGEEEVATALDVDHRGRENRVDDGHEGVVGQFGHEERDEVGFAAAQRTCGGIGDVVEVLSGLFDAINGRGSDLDITAATVEDE